MPGRPATTGWTRFIAGSTAYELAHPNLVEVLDYGNSWCKQQGGCFTTGGQYLSGHDLLVARITNELAAGPKTGRFFTDGGLHAREIATPELAKAFIETLVNGYSVNPDITWLLDQREIYIPLTSNPDGRALVELGIGTEPPYTGNPWYWRKNGNNGIAGSAGCAWPPTSSSHYGVDLNRNHIFKWDVAGGGSTAVCAQDYRGPSAGSEPEILAYENFVRSIIPDQRGPGDNDPAPADATGLLINLHNYVSGGVILVPWGWTSALAPNNAQLVAIAQKMRTYTTSPVYGWQYSLYPVSGNTRDWAYGELGIPAYVIELDGNDFFTTCSLVPNIVNNMLPLLRYAASIADRPYMRVYGPDARTVAASPSSIPSGDALDRHGADQRHAERQSGHQRGRGLSGAPGRADAGRSRHGRSHGRGRRQLQLDRRERAPSRRARLGWAAAATWRWCGARTWATTGGRSRPRPSR